MNNDNQNPKVNRVRSMDMVGGKSYRRMSPEMEAAQARLKHKNADSLPPRPRLRPEYGPMTSASHVTRAGMPELRKRPAVASQGQNSYSKTTSVRTGVSPDGKHQFAELETVELEKFASMDTADDLAASFVEEPKPLETKREENPDAVLEGFEELSVEDLKEGKGPDNNSYALGGKSPFINTLNLEKRPLSGHSVSKKADKGADTTISPRLTTSDTVPTVVANKRKNKRSNIALIIAIVLTVIFGAVVGTFVYLAFFQ